MYIVTFDYRLKNQAWHTGDSATLKKYNFNIKKKELLSTKITIQPN